MRVWGGGGGEGENVTFADWEVGVVEEPAVCSCVCVCVCACDSDGQHITTGIPEISLASLPPTLSLSLHHHPQVPHRNDIPISLQAPPWVTPWLIPTPHPLTHLTLTTPTCLVPVPNHPQRWNGIQTEPLSLKAVL